MLTADQTSRHTSLPDKAIERCTNWLGKKVQIRGGGGKGKGKAKSNHLEHLQLIMSPHRCTLNLHIAII